MSFFVHKSLYNNKHRKFIKVYSKKVLNWLLKTEQGDRSF